jgi:UDP-N-acetyl-D-glucosamine dehydrogenase
VRIDLVVIGLGYVGLPLALEATRAGLTVTGLDISERIVDLLNSGHSHIGDIEDREVAAMRASGFAATTDESVLTRTDAVVICVPTPLSESGGPDLAMVEAACAAVCRHLRPVGFKNSATGHDQGFRRLVRLLPRTRLSGLRARVCA